jgi:GNAT superfamily N-acetyltransferase
LVHLLENIVWHTLSGPQSHFASGAGRSRRYAPGFSPILGFQDPREPDFAGLEPYCEPGEQFYTDGITTPPPAGWTLLAEKSMHKMLWEGAMPEHDLAPDAVPLDASHAEPALELATLTRPGPFGIRTIELGEYFGYFEDGRLVAMAGERMGAGSLREISGVCTHPSAQGRGYARRLMSKLILREMQRGEAPFLHVMTDNPGALGLYERMGFRIRHTSVVRVMEYRPVP